MNRRSTPHVVLATLLFSLAGCAHDWPTAAEVNDSLRGLGEYRAWAWAVGIAAIWADLFLPIPQTAIIAALGIIYGTIGGGLIGGFGLVTGGLLGYALARRFGPVPVRRLVGDRWLDAMQGFFERGGVWAIVLTRSLPYSVPEAVVCLAGLSGMRVGQVGIALAIGSVPTAFVFAAIGAGWVEQPALALAVSYLLPIPLLPPILYLLRRATPAASTPTSDRSGDRRLLARRKP